MNSMYQMLQENDLARTLLDSLPCGVLLVDEGGRVIAVNNIMKHVFGIPGRKMIGRGFGEAFCCLYSYERTEGCGHAEFCDDCEVRKLALTALSQNLPQKARVSFPLVVDNHVKDTTLLFNAAPLKFNENRFSLLIIEELTRLGSTSPSNVADGFRGLTGKTEKMLGLFQTIRDAAPTDVPVLIEGESGTGKELVALAIHNESPRGHRHFVPVNCGALPEGLLESELFGHVKGAFTGASFNKRGRFSIADGGTIFLDEVGELSPAMQVKFLRVLQDGSFEQLGSEKTMQVDVRVISATNSNLAEKVSIGSFRQDLYYRLCVIPITVPPLRDRKEDIPLLAEHFLRQFSEEAWRATVSLAPEAVSILMHRDWPGNVRELQNVLHYAFIKCKGNKIRSEHFPPDMTMNQSWKPHVRHRETKLREEHVVEALKQTEGNKRRAAELLGVSRSSLYRFFSKLEEAG